MRKVLMATPSHDGNVSAWYHHSAQETLRLCMQRAIEFRTALMCYDSLVQNARNDLVALAVQWGADDVIWADADQEWNPEWVFTILGHPVDCVGAAVRKKTDQAELYNVRSTGGPLSFRQHPAAPILTTPDMALGCGFLRLSRKAIMALWDSSEPYNVWGKTPQARWIFDVRPVNGQLIGEDTLMSDKLRALGIETWVDPNMTCGHVGVKKYEGDFAKWLAAAQAAERSKTPPPVRTNDHDLPQPMRAAE